MHPFLSSHNLEPNRHQNLAAATVSCVVERVPIGSAPSSVLGRGNSLSTDSLDSNQTDVSSLVMGLPLPMTRNLGGVAAHLFASSLRCHLRPQNIPPPPSPSAVRHVDIPAQDVPSNSDPLQSPIRVRRLPSHHLPPTPSPALFVFASRVYSPSRPICSHSSIIPRRNSRVSFCTTVTCTTIFHRCSSTSIPQIKSLTAVFIVAFSRFATGCSTYSSFSARLCTGIFESRHRSKAARYIIVGFRFHHQTLSSSSLQKYFFSSLSSSYIVLILITWSLSSYFPFTLKHLGSYDYLTDMISFLSSHATCSLIDHILF
ncbi:hypothetical protein MVEN_00048100 [Mycena venus]|uniref:Uncharacterized protein n=1 Tax=Mycena venus TaxID=2733690 RepID=A0A8H7DDW9_9AGAR|nr:hypothetical protein MVEN_00048100 [Mycena venus]